MDELVVFAVFFFSTIRLLICGTIVRGMTTPGAPMTINGAGRFTAYILITILIVFFLGGAQERKNDAGIVKGHLSHRILHGVLRESHR